MSMFSTLLGKIFSHSSTPTPAPSTPQPVGGTPGIGATADGGSSNPASAPAETPASAPVATPAAAPAASPAQSVDAGAILDDLASKSSEKLDWKQSIVDLMKLVGMDSSLTARKHLATELNYTGDESDSATMNVWLHKEVLKKIAENGGKLPTGLGS